MRNLTLLTDLYQLTMGYGFYKNGKHEETVTFDLFFRRRELISYSIAAGLEQAMDYLLNWHFDDEDIAYLRSLNLFDEEFLAYIKNMRFTGDVYAVREGEIVFPSEPILTVKAPLIQAQFAETALLNIINHQTLIATKSSKISRATGGNGIVMEFGLRRAQGPDAGIYGARAAIIGGCSSTSNVLAGQMFDVPVAGTMAHSFVMDYPTEYDAFRAYAKAYREELVQKLKTALREKGVQLDYAVENCILAKLSIDEAKSLLKALSRKDQKVKVQLSGKESDEPVGNTEFRI